MFYNVNIAKYKNYSCLVTSSIIWVTASGFKSVDVSPNWSISLQAIFLKISRMIFPLRVLGNAGTKIILSGLAIAPIVFAIKAFISEGNSSETDFPSCKIT